MFVMILVFELISNGDIVRNGGTLRTTHKLKSEKNSHAIIYTNMKKLSGRGREKR